jgi:hypothetical protein
VVSRKARLGLEYVVARKARSVLGHEVGHRVGVRCRLEWLRHSEKQVREYEASRKVCFVRFQGADRAPVRTVALGNLCCRQSGPASLYGGIMK